MSDFLDDYLTDEELFAALRLGSKRTLERMRRNEGAPPSIVVGRKRYTHKDSVREWLRALPGERRRA